MVRELGKSRPRNRETCHISLIHEFVKIQNIVLEFVNRTLPEGASIIKALDSKQMSYSSETLIKFWSQILCKDFKESKLTFSNKCHNQNYASIDLKNCSKSVES